MKKIILVLTAIIALALPKIGAIEPGEYIISSEFGKVLDVDTRSTNKGVSKIQLWDNVPNNTNQRWIVAGSDTRGYTIRCATNNHYLSADPVEGGQLTLSVNHDDKTTVWGISVSGIQTAKGQECYIFRSPYGDGIDELLNVATNIRNTNGAPVTSIKSAKPYLPAVAKWYFRPADKTRVKVTFKGISLTNIHNDDCKKVWGTVRAELWEMNGDGSNARQIANPFAGDALMMNWTGKTKRNIPNYGVLTNYMTVDNVNSSVVFSVDPSFLVDNSFGSPDSRVRQRTIVLKIFTRINAAHKSCDLCTDYTEAAGVRGDQQQTLYINNAWQSKLNRRFTAKDGPMLAGPFRSASITDHFYRLHFDIEKLD